jgi:DnaJ-domain-containing protein 1
MDFTRRVRRIIKGYMKSARERLDELEAELNARRELEDYLKPAAEPTSPPAESSTSASTSSRSTPLPGESGAPSQTPQMSPELLSHFRLLGIPPNADIRQAQAAYKQLMERAKPDRFPEGSEERRRAQQLCQRIQQAYDAVRQHLDPTSARFDRLEI